MDKPMLRVLKSRDALSSNRSYSFWDVNWSGPVALISAIALCCSVAFQLGYFLAIDERLLFLFSIQDAVVHAVPFVPIVLSAYFLSIASTTDKVSKSRDGAVNEEVDKPLSLTWKLAIAAVLFVVLGFVLYVSYWFATSLVAFFAFVHQQERRHESGLADKNQFFDVAVLTLCGLMAVGGWGEVIAETDLNSKRRDYRITVNGKKADVLLLSASADFLIVRDDVRTVRVVPRAKIEELAVLDVHGVSNALWPRLRNYFSPPVAPLPKR
jgi:hypothetical protein